MKNFKKQAQSLIEYGLILALVAIVAMVVLGKFGTTLTAAGNKANSAVSAASGNATSNYCRSVGCSGYDDATGQCTGCP